MIRQSIFVLLTWFLTGFAAQAGTELIMVEEQGCMFCERWNAEIAPIYPKTEEGKEAPLRRVDLRRGMPDDLLLRNHPRYTPTFILVRDGKEVSRIEGYPGEDFFWGLLGMMLEQESSERSGG